jgi:hypothetical protein
MRGTTIVLVLLLLLPSISATESRTQLRDLVNPVVDVQQQPDGALFTVQSGVLRVQVCLPAIIRVRC